LKFARPIFSNRDIGLHTADDLGKVAAFCLAFRNPQRFKWRLEDFHLLLQFGDSVRKPKRHPVF